MQDLTMATKGSFKYPQWGSIDTHNYEMILPATITLPVEFAPPIDLGTTDFPILRCDR